MDKILIRIAIVIAIAFMASVSGGIWWMFFGDASDVETRIFCPRCGTEFNVEIPYCIKRYVKQRKTSTKRWIRS